MSNPTPAAPLVTRTGLFPIGFRRGGSPWQKELGAVADFARHNGFAFIDLGGDVKPDWNGVLAAGLRIGTADLLDFRSLLSPDPAKRADIIARNIAHIREAAQLGVRAFFCVMVPEDKDLPRKQNFEYVVECVAALVPALEAAGATLAIEGWPGPGALCCTPETYRALFRDVPSPAVAINYDPSHLIRMGIDPLRFLEEFVARVVHVHGKDTEILSENLYEFGHEQPATFAPAAAYGAWSWRYTIPGHGQMRWTRALQILHNAGYKGLVSIELEDARFNGTTQGEQQGLLAAAQYLATC